ncbi:unnamed protein product [Caenorhabditis brenneri]
MVWIKWDESAIVCSMWKLFNPLYWLFLTFNGLNAAVLTCLVTSGSDCPCGDIFDYASNPEDISYTKQSGCVQNISCPIHYYTNVYSKMNESEIPKPANALQEIDTFVFQTNLNRADPAGPAIDIFSYFGMVCESNTWFATKYPNGISYYNSNEEFTTTGFPNEYNGRKSKISHFSCWSLNDE